MTVFSLEDKYVLLQAENARLKRQLGKAYEAMYHWKEQALFFQAEQDLYREQIQEEF
jgi:hypothetical protein